MTRSGIDMLEEILSHLVNLEKRLDVMDNNIKTIINSTNLAELVEKATNTPLDGWARATAPGISDVNKKIDKIKQKSGFQNFNFEPVDAAKLKDNRIKNKTNRPVLKKSKSIMVKGKLKIAKGESAVPLANASVKIYDEKDKLIKQTKTNRAGHWMSQLPSGRYVALFEGEINGKKLLPQNINFEVPEKLPDGQTELEIT
jgi:hypothetical protein